MKRDLIFYQQLGKLFYAIAAADQTIRDEEFSRLQYCVLTYWLDLDDLTDAFGSDAAYLIEMVFEGAEAFELDAEELFETFLSYAKKHPSLFSSKLNKVILKTCYAIADAFSGVNKAELIYLTRLKMELDDLLTLPSNS